MIDFPRWAAIAFDELLLSVREIPGDHHAERIIDYHRTTSLRASTDEVPWCSAGVNWCLRTAGIRGTDSAAARSWLAWGERLEAPRVGAITIFSRGAPGGHQGHVALFLRVVGVTDVQVIGGNQSDQWTVARYPASRLLGYRWPRPTDYFI